MQKTKTLIPPHYFYEPSIFSKEKEKIFNPTWIFIGFIDDISQPDHYITLEHMGLPIIVKNFSGELKAFLNVCSHRFSKICVHKTGHGPLQCPYHGWTYDKEGAPYAIPGKKHFTHLEIENLKLQPFLVQSIGRFLFLKLAADSLSLEEFLGDRINFLTQVSTALGGKLDTNQITMAANWKIIIENTLEEYHVRQVHPESLYKVDIQASQFAFQAEHSSDTMLFKMKFSDFKKLPDLMKDRVWHVEDYVHQLIFPNMTIASAFGTTIAIQQVIPINATNSIFISHVFAAKLPANEEHPVIKAFNDNAINFNRKVFEEDRIVCELVQEGVQHTNKKNGVLSEKEERVWFFEKCYMGRMK